MNNFFKPPVPYSQLVPHPQPHDHPIAWPLYWNGLKQLGEQIHRQRMAGWHADPSLSALRGAMAPTTRKLPRR